jgi:hypothetical protein
MSELRTRFGRSALAGAALVLLALGTTPAAAQLIRRHHGQLLLDPLLCQTNYQVRQAIAARGFTNIYLNAPIESQIQVRATRGNTVYLIDYNRCFGHIDSISPLRPAR